MYYDIIRNLTFQYPKYQLGFFWISRIRCGFKFDISISIKRKIVSEDCPKCCPCCGVSVPCFSHWIFSCKELENFRNNLFKMNLMFYIVLNWICSNIGVV